MGRWRRWRPRRLRRCRSALATRSWRAATCAWATLCCWSTATRACPEDCILPVVSELLRSPHVAFTQHFTTPLQARTRLHSVRRQCCMLPEICPWKAAFGALALAYLCASNSEVAVSCPCAAAFPY